MHSLEYKPWQVKIQGISNGAEENETYHGRPVEGPGRGDHDHGRDCESISVSSQRVDLLGKLTYSYLDP